MAIIGKISQLLTRFFGSRWAIILHIALVIFWLIFHLNLEVLTLMISLEAIFIWMIYLSAARQQEKKDRHLEALQQIQIKEKMIDNLANGEKHNEKLDNITKMLYDLEAQVKTLKKKSS